MCHNIILFLYDMNCVLLLYLFSILSVPVVNRYMCTVELSSSGCGGKKSLQLFGHPNVLYLPSKLTGSLLYETVDRIVPLLANYSIVLTNGQVDIAILCCV